MNEQDIQLKIQTAIDTAKAAKSLKELKTSLRELQSLSIEYGEDSPEIFNKVTNAAGALRDKIGDIKSAIGAVSGEPIEKVGGSIGLVQSSISSLDFGQAINGIKLLSQSIKDISIKDVTGQIKDLSKAFLDLGKTILQSIGNGIKERFNSLKDSLGQFGGALKAVGSGDFTGALEAVKGGFKSLGEVIKVNPIFLLASVVALIIAKFDDLKNAGGLVGKVFSAVGSIIKGVIDAITWFTDAIGLTNVAGNKATKELLENKTKEKEAIEERYDAEIQLAKASGKETEDLEKKKAIAARETVMAQIRALNDIKAENGKLSDEQQKQLDELSKQWRKYTYDIVALERQKVKAIADANKKLETDIQDLQVKLIKDKTKQATEQAKLDTQRKVEEIKKSVADEKEKQQAIKLTQELGQKQINDALEAQRTENEQKAEAAAAKSKAAAQKAAADAKKKAEDGLKSLQTQGETILIQEKDLSQKRLDLLKSNLDSQIQYIKDHQKQLALTDDRRESEIAKLTAQKESYEKEYSDYVIALTNRRNTAIAQLELIQAKNGEDLLNARIKQLEVKKDADLSNEKLTQEERKAIIGQAEKDINDLKEKYRNADTTAYNNRLLAQSEFEKGLLDKYAVFQVQRRTDLAEQIFQQKAVQLETQKNQELANVELTEQQKAEIIEKYRELEIQNAKDAEQQKLQAKLDAADRGIQIAQSGANAIMALGDLITQSENNRLKKGDKASLELQHKQFKRQKALGIVGAVINTAQAVVQGLNNPFPLNIAMAALAGITGALQIAKIASAKFNPDSGGDAGSGGGVPSLPGGSGAEASKAPTFQAPSFFGLGQGSSNLPDQQPVKVYVTESDISRTQAKVQVIESRAKIP